MLDKNNFMQKIYIAGGGSYSNDMISRLKKSHGDLWDRKLEPYIDYLRGKLSPSGFGDFSTYLETNYVQYAEEGYQLGFNDGMRFLVSVMADKPLSYVLKNMEK